MVEKIRIELAARIARREEDTRLLEELRRKNDIAIRRADFVKRVLQRA